jgi:hypothetical protein
MDSRVMCPHPNIGPARPKTVVIYVARIDVGTACDCWRQIAVFLRRYTPPDERSLRRPAKTSGGVC